jgi:hypothetical protein
MRRIGPALTIVFCAMIVAAQTQPTSKPPNVTPPAENPQAQEKVPDAPSTKYTPLTARQKFGTFARRVYSPYTFTGVLFNATYAQATDQWPGYGQGMEGWGKRIGCTYADTQVRSFFQSFLLPTVLHQDPRYFRSTKKGFVPRGWYAATRVLVTRKDTGVNTFNTSQVVGTLFTSSVNNAYYPERDRGFGDTMSRAFGSLLSDASSNVLREFWPDIKRIVRRHTPERIKKIEDKLPMAKIEKVTQGPPSENQPPEPEAKQQPPELPPPAAAQSPPK